MAGDSKPKKMLIGGIVIMVIATIGGVTALVLGITKISGVANEITSSDNVSLPGAETVAGSGDQFTVWSTSSFVNCTVNGGDVTFNTSASTSQSTDVEGQSFNLVGWFDTSSGQDFTVDCDGTPGETFSVIEVSFSALATGIGLLVGSFLGGFGLFFIGLVFVIIALFRRSSWKKRHGGGMGPGGYQPPPGQQGWGGQPQAPGPAGWTPTGGGQGPGPGQGGSFPGQAPPPGGQAPPPGGQAPPPGGQAAPPGGQAPPPPGGQPPPFGNAPTAPGGPPQPPPAPGGQGGAPPPPPPR